MIKYSIQLNTSNLLHPDVCESVDNVGLADHFIKPVLDCGVVRPPHFGSPVAEIERERERVDYRIRVLVLLLAMLQSHNLLNHNCHFLFFGHRQAQHQLKSKKYPSIWFFLAPRRRRRRNAAMQRLKINESEITYNWSHGYFYGQMML